MQIFASDYTKEIRRIIVHLSRRQRMAACWQFAGMSVLSMIELAVAAGVSMLAAALADPGRVQELVFGYSRKFGLPMHEFTLLQDPRNVPLLLALTVFCCILGKNALASYLSWHGATLAEDVAQSLGVKLFRSYLYRPYVWHSTANTADLQQKLSWRSQIAQMLNAYNMLGTQLLTVAILFAGLLVVTPGITALVLLIIGGAAFMTYSRIKLPAEQRSKKAVEAIRDANRTAMAALQGIREVLIYRQQEAFAGHFARKAHEAGRLNALKPLVSLMPVWVLEIVGFGMLCMALVIMVLLMEASAARITGTMALLAAVAWRVLPAMNKTVSASLTIRTLQPNVAPTLGALEEDPQPGEAPLGACDLGFEKSILLDRIDFRYPGSEHDALKGITLGIAKGEMVGVIGASGAGKTTLIGLLCGLLEPTKGTILIDGKHLNASNSPAWMRRIGYVPQSPYLLDGTLAENVAFSQWGKPVDRERALECCRMAAMDFLDQLSQGIDTPIGERGTRISGGQAQRVAIARALYSNPDCIIFDEATSALDSSSEQAIQQTINSLKQQVTCILVAHRLTTVENCDTIYMLEQGRIVRSGPPAEVLLSSR